MEEEKSFVADEKRLLAIAALFEGEFFIEWLENITGKRRSQILPILEKENRRGLLTMRKPGCFFFADYDAKERYSNYLTLGDKKCVQSHISKMLLKELVGGYMNFQTKILSLLKDVIDDVFIPHR